MYKGSCFGCSEFEHLEYGDKCIEILNTFTNNRIKKFSQEISKKEVNIHSEISMYGQAISKNASIKNNVINYGDMRLYYAGEIFPMETFIYNKPNISSHYVKIFYIEEHNIGYILAKQSDTNKSILYIPNATIYYDENGLMLQYIGRCNGITIIRDDNEKGDKNDE